MCLYRAVSSVFICTSEWITGVVTGSRTVTLPYCLLILPVQKKTQFLKWMCDNIVAIDNMSDFQSLLWLHDFPLQVFASPFSKWTIWLLFSAPVEACLWSRTQTASDCGSASDLVLICCWPGADRTQAGRQTLEPKTPSFDVDLHPVWGSDPCHRYHLPNHTPPHRSAVQTEIKLVLLSLWEVIKHFYISTFCERGPWRKPLSDSVWPWVVQSQTQESMSFITLGIKRSFLQK